MPGIDGDSISQFMVHTVLPRCQHDQITAVRKILTPVPGSGTVAVIIAREKRTVAQRLKYGIDREQNFTCCLVVGEIVAGKPIAIVLALSLRPYLSGIVRETGVGGDEIQSPLRLAGIGNADAAGVRMSQRFWEQNAKL